MKNQKKDKLNSQNISEFDLGLKGNLGNNTDIHEKTIHDNRISAIPVTEQQAELLSACLLGGDDANRSFNQIASISIEGEVSANIIHQTFSILVSRHEAFRMTFDLNKATFSILQEISVLLDIKEYDELDDNTENAFDAIIEQEAEFVFDLSKGPLFRFSLLKSKRKNHMVFNIHHLVFDGWTLGLIVKEIADIYNILSNGTCPNICHASSYSEYALKEHRFTCTNEYSEMMRYHLSKLKDNMETSPLPYDMPRKEELSFRSGNVSIEIEETPFRKLLQISEQNGNSLMLTLLSVFELLLYSDSGQKTIISGVPAAGQHISGFDDLSGHCVYLMPVLSHPNEAISFLDYLKKRKIEFAENLQNRRVTYGSILKELKKDRSLAANPLISHTFNIYRQLSEDIVLNGYNADVRIHPRKYGFFDLLVNVRRNSDSLEIDFGYKLDLFERQTIYGLIVRYKSLLTEFISRPERGIMDILSENTSEEKHMLAGRLYNEIFNGDPVFCTFPSWINVNIEEYPTYKIIKRDFNSKGIEYFNRIQSKYDIGYLALSQSLLSILAYRYSGQTDFITGMILTDSISKVIKPTDIFPVRSRFSGDDTFRSVLIEMNQSFSVMRIGTPLKTMSETHKHGLFKEKIDQIRIYLMICDDGESSESYDLDLLKNSGNIIFQLYRNSNKFGIYLHFDENIFGHDMMNRLLGNLEVLLSSVCLKPDFKILNCELLDAKEKDFLVNELNQTEKPYSRTLTLVDMIEMGSRINPENIAIDDGIEKVTYRKMLERSNALAIKLKQLSDLEDVYIGVQMERSVRMIIAVVAIIESGKAYLPMEPNIPDERKLTILNSVRCALILTDEDSDIDRRFLGFRHLPIKDFDDFKLNDSVDEFKKVSPDDTAYIIFTSGTTGIPKGVVVKHRSVINLIEWVNREFNVNDKDTILATASLSFDLSVYDIFGILSAGACIRIARNTELKDPWILSKILSKNGISFWNSAPQVLQQLLPFLANMSDPPLNSPRLFFLSGDWIPLGMPDEIRKTFPATKVVSLGGATEATVWSNFHIIEGIRQEWKSIPYGRPVQNARYYILNQALQPQPRGVCGDLYIGGDVLAAGYNDSELSATKFIQDPFVTSSRMYKTGDLARYFEDGNIEFLGRSDTQVKIRGYRIELSEIETVLQKFPGTVQAFVTVEYTKGRQKSLTAFIQNGDHPSKIDIILYLSQILPKYMIPSKFIILKDFPINMNGKIDRKKLLSEDYSEAIDTDEDCKPQNETEEQICRILEEILEIDEVGRNSNFFEIGGHSLKAIELIVRIETLTSYKMSMSSIFKNPTAALIAKLIYENKKEEWKYLVAIKPDGNRPPLYLVHGAGLGVMVFKDIASSLDSNQPVYGIQAMGMNNDELPFDDLGKIATAYLDEIIRHNENGPYLLAGFSAGSVIAHEIAIQLKSLGKNVAFLGNFDFSLENLKPSTAREKLIKLIPEFLPRQIHSIKNLFKHPKKAIEFQLNFAKLRYKGILRRLHLISQKDKEPGIEKIYLLMEIYQEAFNRYAPRCFDGKIDIFISKVKMYYLNDSHSLGWNPYAKGGIRIHWVEGDHDHMLTHPNSIKFSAVLQSVIDSNLNGIS